MYVPVLSQTPIPRMTSQSRKRKNKKRGMKYKDLCALRLYLKQSHVGQSSLMWDSAVLYGTKLSHKKKSILMKDWAIWFWYMTDESYVKHSGLTWDRVVSIGTEQSYGGHNNHSGIEQFIVGHNSLMWDRVVSCGTKESYVEQSGLFWNIKVSCGTE